MTTTLGIAITGAGGAGVISCGELLLQAWGKRGGRGLLRKAFGPQIRGGESAALLKLSDARRHTPAAAYDLLLALDWNNFERFQDEIHLNPGAIVICENSLSVPATVMAAGVSVREVPLQELAAQSHPQGRVNMLGLGLLGGALGLDADSLIALAREKLAGKPHEYLEASAACIHAGVEQALDCTLDLPATNGSNHWYISGNQAAGLGALEAGVRFVAAYPITPASDVLEWMAGPLEKVGGHLLQAEDELAAINMSLGAAFGGTPSFTATSGPGLALMSESIGLAVASETPVTVLNVMRGGPSTGIPTKSEQSDLNIALYGLHGDAPHLVVAPLDIADCRFTTGWAVSLAQQLQSAAIVLSDQLLGQSTAVIESPPRFENVSAAVAEEVDGDYLRYRLTESGISTLASPGDRGQRFTADGLEHNERGTPSANAEDHRLQLEKRRHKLLQHDYADHWGRCSGEGATALVCFGSTTAAAEEAAEQLTRAGYPVRVVGLRLLAPLLEAALCDALSDCETVLVIEQNQGGQLFHYLRGQLEHDAEWHSLARPGPVPLDAHSITQFTLERIA